MKGASDSIQGRVVFVFGNSDCQLSYATRRRMRVLLLLSLLLLLLLLSAVLIRNDSLRTPSCGRPAASDERPWTALVLAHTVAFPVAQVQGQHALCRHAGHHPGHRAADVCQHLHRTGAAGENPRRLRAETLGIPFGELRCDVMIDTRLSSVWIVIAASGDAFPGPLRVSVAAAGVREAVPRAAGGAGAPPAATHRNGGEGQNGGTLGLSGVLLSAGDCQVCAHFEGDRR